MRNKIPAASCILSESSIDESSEPPQVVPIAAVQNPHKRLERDHAAVVTTARGGIVFVPSLFSLRGSGVDQPLKKCRRPRRARPRADRASSWRSSKGASPYMLLWSDPGDAVALRAPLRELAARHIGLTDAKSSRRLR